MTKILAIGNSFSQDATIYLHAMAKYAAIETKVANLYIGGCSLKVHWENAASEARHYDFELNGAYTGQKTSIKEVLDSDDWDIVVMQQASFDSGIVETYYPYITLLSRYIAAYAPRAMQAIHQTWAYEIDSTHEAFRLYGYDQLRMYRALKKAYNQVSNELGLKFIPCGDIIQTLRQYKEFDYANGGQSLCRDGFHLHFLYGRYAAAAIWYKTLLKGDVIKNDFLPLDEHGDLNTALISKIKNVVGHVHKTLWLE